MPYFQPIVALDSRQVMGYEALGRLATSEGVRSLGPFFEDRTVSMADHIRVDRRLREQALKTFAGGKGTALAPAPDGTKLFLNLKPSWIFETYARTGDLPTLRLMDKHGVDPGRVVIEITEEAFTEPMEQLRPVVDVYRRAGCLIAIDDVGSGFSNLDRIARLQPHVLKIDIHMLRESGKHTGYYGVLRSFSTLADQIGASLLVEGVETELELQRAIEIGARYAQGFLFAPAEPVFHPPLGFSSLIGRGLELRRLRMLEAGRHWRAKACRLRTAVDRARREGEAASGGAVEDAFIEQLLPDLDDSCIRVYLCGEDGIQLSANYRREAGDVWSRETSYRGFNWSWRPYFIPAFVRLEAGPGAIVSSDYTDLDSTRRIRTVCIPVPGYGLLFADMTEARETEEETGA